MTMQQALDKPAIIRPERERAMRVRNAYLELLRAFEDMYDLPRSIPTKVERGESAPKTEHHNRG